MKIDEALYQIKQRIKMHELKHTTNAVNEREKALLDYITNLQEEITGLDIALDSGVKNIKEKQQRIDKAVEYIEKNRVKATPLFKQFDGDLILPHKEVNNLINILRGDE